MSYDSGSGPYPHLMHRPYKKKVTAQTIYTKQNPTITGAGRTGKGWLITTPDGEMVGFLPQERDPIGMTRLRIIFPKAVELEEVRVTQAEFMSFVRELGIQPDGGWSRALF